MKTWRFVTVPLTAKKTTLSRPRRVWKTSSKLSICHQWFNLNVMTRILLVRKERKITTLFNNLSPPRFPPRHRSAILESIRWTQTVYAVHGYVFYIYLHFHLNENSVSMWCSWQRRPYAVCVQRIFSKMELRWHGGENCWIKSLFLVSLHTKSILIAL